MRIRRSRSRAQSIVEFGGIAVFLTLLIAAVIDFAVLMNDWLAVASDARQLARDAAVGGEQGQLIATASGYEIAGVTTEGGWFSHYCCGAPGAGNPHGDALVLKVTYFDQCIPAPNTSNCKSVSDPATLDSRYGGTCNTNCAHPARPSARSATNPTCLGNPLVDPPCPGDSVQVSLTAAGARALTPMLQGLCPNNPAPYCNVPMTSTVVMRFDGTRF